MLLVSFSKQKKKKQKKKKKKFVTGFNLDLLLISLFYWLIIACYIKFVVKFCGHNILTLFFNVRFTIIKYCLLAWSSKINIIRQNILQIKNQHQAKSALHYPTWNPWLKITERPLFKHPVKTSKGFGDFKHALKRIWGF